jgi:hypothetical protein
VTCFGLDPDERWFVAALRGLQGRGELEAVCRHNPIIVIGSCDERRGITTALRDVVER